jgi:microsomal dipeptidase-like Zn-dependent dipeptidase
MNFSKLRARAIVGVGVAATVFFAGGCDGLANQSERAVDGVAASFLALGDDVARDRASEAGLAYANYPGPLKGYADLHIHMFGEAMFGGGWLHGHAHHPDDTWALRRCSGNLGSTDHAATRFGPLNEFLSGNGVTDGDAGWHFGKRRGYDRRHRWFRKEHWEHWPSWDAIAHQQVWQGHLKEAHLQGLTLAVVSAVDFRPMCEVMENRKSHLLKNGKCNEYTSIKWQLQEANNFANAHDWATIALSPAHARSIVKSGRLAIILSVEATEPFDNRTDWISVLNEYHALGVRTFQMGSHINSRFAGATVMNKAYNAMQWLENYFRNGQCFSINGGTRCNYNDLTTVDMVGILETNPRNGFTCRNASGQVGTCNAGAGYTNEVGLTPLGVQLANALMDRDMVIDIAHMSERAVQDLFAVAQSRNNHALYSSHSHFRERLKGSDNHMANQEQEKPLTQMHINVIKTTGGMVGLRTGPDYAATYTPSGVTNNCEGSSRSFAQSLAWGVDQGLNMAWATDLNGFIQQMVPRTGSEGCREASTAGQSYSWSAPSSSVSDGLGNYNYPSSWYREWYTKQGFGHIGLLRPVYEDMRMMGLKQKYLDNLGASTENYVQMWESVQ